MTRALVALNAARLPLDDLVLNAVVSCGLARLAVAPSSAVIAMAIDLCYRDGYKSTAPHRSRKEYFTMTHIDLASSLREAIQACGQSQNALAKTAEISQPVLSDFLAGKKDMYLETANKLCHALPFNPFGGFMPWRTNNHTHVAVVLAPNISRERFCLLTQAGQHSWVLRDFITDSKLIRAPHPNPSTSSLALNQILAEVTDWGPVPYHDVDDAEAWRSYLRMLTTGFTGKRRCDMRPASVRFGNWGPIL
jgi:DNA-binding XRE family transcriptional regulator